MFSALIRFFSSLDKFVYLLLCICEFLTVKLNLLKSLLDNICGMYLMKNLQIIFENVFSFGFTSVIL